jgi:hypothetical protein
MNSIKEWVGIVGGSIVGAGYIAGMVWIVFAMSG